MLVYDVWITIFKNAVYTEHLHAIEFLIELVSVHSGHSSDSSWYLFSKYIYYLFVIFTALHSEGMIIVSVFSASDPHNLGLRCIVNGVVKQDSNTGQLVHKTAALVAFITRYQHSTQSRRHFSMSSSRCSGLRLDIWPIWIITDLWNFYQ